MKKYVIILQVLISFFTLSCNAQQQDFKEYLSNFNDVKLPFKIIDRETHRAIFAPKGEFYEVNKKFVKKFLYKDSINEFGSSNYMIFHYGAKYELNGNHIVLVRKIYEDTTLYYYDDSAEEILVVYSPIGKILSSQSISKDNESCMSDVNFLAKDKITVQQIKILGYPNEPEKDCEIEMLEYKIDSKGIIHKKRTAPIKKAVAVWDEETGYTLKKDND